MPCLAESLPVEIKKAGLVSKRLLQWEISANVQLGPELLNAKDIPFKLLDLTDDEAKRSWATTQAKQLEFPLLFIAGEPVGGLHELTALDVNGELIPRVFGTVR